VTRGAAALVICCACGAVAPESYSWPGGPEDRARQGNLTVRWRQRLTRPFGGAYVPVEHASAALDPSRNRIYVGTSEGGFFAFNSDGRQHYRYDPEGAVEAAPAIDRRWGEVYLVTEEGIVHAIRGRDANLRWKESVGAPVRQAPVLTEDAVYVVTEDDQVVSLSRESGELLWTYQKESDQEYAISGHAGLALTDETVITAMTDGTVVALDLGDGSPVWERPTQLDVEIDRSAPVRFFDVDTTPLVVGDTVYAASFTAGLYALSKSNGSVEWRDPELTGITGLTAAGRILVIASADHGVLALDRGTRRRIWEREIERGAPSTPVVTESGLVLVGESAGSLLALSLRGGDEVARVDAGSGFSAPVAVAGQYGWALSNGGSLLALAL